jgi:hypothetical protein
VALGGFARTLLLVGAVISMLGHTGAMILATPRMLFAFARDGFLPGGLARLIRRINRRSPRSSCRASSCSCSRSPARSSGWRFSRTFSILVMYGMCCLATWQLRRRDVRAGGTPFKVRRQQA